MNDQKKIYVVDDEEINLDLMEGILEDDFEVECFSDGEKFLNHYQSSPCDIVLLDVEMPNVSGLEVCRQLQEMEPNCPAIFISTRSSNEERLEGYSAGGHDYIVKPCDPSELMAKITIILEQQEQYKTLDNTRQEIFDGFMEAATGSGEQGVLLQFAVEVFAIKDYQKLAELVVSTLQQLAGLNGAVLIHGRDQDVSYSNKGPCSPMEEEIMAMLVEKGRIYTFSNRTQINEKNVSVLIKNMPEDEKIAGRMLDHIPMLLRIASACVDNINTSHNLVSSLQVIETVQKVSEELDISEGELRRSVGSFIEITEDEFQRMENEMQFLALSEEQEVKLQTSYTSTLAQARKSTNDAIEVCDGLGDIVKNLKNLL
jgi:DNA-binding response OmpR family regulator